MGREGAIAGVLALLVLAEKKGPPGVTSTDAAAWRSDGPAVRSLHLVQAVAVALTGRFMTSNFPSTEAQ